MRRLLVLPFLFVSAVFGQTADPQPLVDKALSAVGGKDKLLKNFRIKEIFHFGGTPEPAEGKKRSIRESILSQPDKHRLDWRSDFYRFSDWKEHDGLKFASKTIIFKLKDGKPWFFHEVTELERLSKLPEGLAKP